MRVDYRHVCSSCQLGLRPEDILQSAKWSPPKPACCTVQVRKQQFIAAYRASWKCRGPNSVWCVFNVTICDGWCTLNRFYELQSRWKEHRYSKHRSDEESFRVRTASSHSKCVKYSSLGSGVALQLPPWASLHEVTHKGGGSSSMKSKKGLSQGDGWDDWMGQTLDFPPENGAASYLRAICLKWAFFNPVWSSMKYDLFPSLTK